jgi:DNA-binding beta-propeller fold protein YncE
MRSKGASDGWDAQEAALGEMRRRHAADAKLPTGRCCRIHPSHPQHPPPTPPGLAPLLCRRVDAATGIITTVAGSGVIPPSNATGVEGGDGQLATAATLWKPHSVAVDAAGNIYIAEKNGNGVRRVDAATGIISTVVGRQRRAGYSGDGGSAVDAALYWPFGALLMPNGQMVIADSYNHILRIVNLTMQCTPPSGVPLRPALGLCPQASCHCQH